MVANFKKNKKDKKRSIFFSVSLGVLFLLLISFLIHTNFKLSQRRKNLISRIEVLKKEIQVLESKNEGLRGKISQTESKDYLEKVAREQLGFKGAGEEVVVITSEEDQKEEKEEEKEESKKWWERLKFWEK